MDRHPALMFTFTETTDFTQSPRAGSVIAWHIRETSGEDPAVVNLRNGSASGPILASISIVAGDSKHFAAYRPQLAPHGVYVEVEGTVQGAIQPG